MPLFLIFFGLALLLFGADFFVSASINVARRFRISELAIGLTLVTLGTNIPEIVVAITGAIYKNANGATSDLVVGEIIGSNISQIALILGLVGLLGVMDMKKKALIYQATFLIGSVVLLIVFSQDLFISKAEGLFMILAYIIYLIPISRSAHAGAKKIKVKTSAYIDATKMLVGLIGIIFGAKLAIDNSIILAEEFHISKTLIGLFILGVGTSLPELIVALTAFIKKASNVSVGNLIGSNILDALLALGLGASISGFKVDKALLNFDLPFLLFLSVIVIVFFYTREKFEKKESVLVILLYFGYVFLKLLTVV